MVISSLVGEDRKGEGNGTHPAGSEITGRGAWQAPVQGSQGVRHTEQTKGSIIEIRCKMFTSVQALVSDGVNIIF